MFLLPQQRRRRTRAYAAAKKGYSIPARALKDTTDWVTQPSRWDSNKGDPGFSDKRLAAVKFGAALLAAFESGYTTDLAALRDAVRRLAAEQGTDGSWNIELGNAVGSAATYGTPLATFLALETLRGAKLPELERPIENGKRWLSQVMPNNLLSTSSLLLAMTGNLDPTTRSKRQSLLKRALSGERLRQENWESFRRAFLSS